MKKILSTAVSLAACALLSSNVVSCLNWMDAKKWFYDDRTTEQIEDEKQMDAALDENMGKANLFDSNKKVLMIGLDGIGYDAQARSIYKDIYDFDKQTGVADGKHDEVTDSGIKYIMNYESEAGWDSAWYGNIFGPSKDEELNKKTRNVFDEIADGGGVTEAQMNNWVENTFLTPRKGTFPNGKIYWPSEENDMCESYVDEKGIEIKMNESLNLMARMLSGGKIATWDGIDSADDITDTTANPDAMNTAANGAISLYHIFNEISDVCGHSHMGYGSKVIVRMQELYNKMFSKFFDDTIFRHEKWLVLSTTDHGRDADGKEHLNGDPMSHQTFVIANNNLDDIMKMGTANGQKEFKNLYDIKTLVWNWLYKGDNQSEVA